MKSPFKFLDAFTTADRDLFFGRDKEIDALYNMVYKTPLVMVYGLSGTGKTSLVQCGLAKKFKGPDWLPFLIRKEENINSSLRKSLQSALEPEQHSKDIKELVERLFYKYFRPVYLLFDQFEELFILGSPEEQKQFMQDIQRLQEAELPCRVVLILREEYIGQLYEFEKVIPTLFDYKLRVEPMTNKYIKEVMLQSFEAFNISVEAPAEARYEQMIQKLSSGKSNIPLPYLQVYLDMLYREDYQRTYPNGSDQVLPTMEFTKKEIDDFGAIDDVLERFLSEQTNNIQQLLYKKDNRLSKDTVKMVLDAFVTDEGTKRPVHYSRNEADHIILEKAVREQLPALSEGNLSFCLQALEEARLLRFRDDTVELAHDTLAALIDQQRTDEQRVLNEMRREIKSSFNIHQQTGDFLSLGQLELYRPHLKALKLSKPQQELVKKSESFHLAEAKRKEEELEQERLLRDKAEKNERKAGQRTKIASMIAVLAILASVFALYSYAMAQQSQAVARMERSAAESAQLDAENQKKEAIKNLDLAELNEQKAKEQRKIAEDAFLDAEKQKLRALSNERIATQQKKLVEQKVTELALASQQAAEKRIVAEREKDQVEAQKAILENRNKETIRNFEKQIEQLQLQSGKQEQSILDSIKVLQSKIDSLISTENNN